MKSLDIEKREQTALLAEAQQLLTDGDAEQAAEKMASYFDAKVQEVMNAHDLYEKTHDEQILASRGVRSLTSTEREFYEKMITALEGNDYKQAVTGLDLTIPETVIETVFENLKGEHAILNYVDLRYITENVKIIVNKGARDKAVWGAICADITKEIAGQLEAVEAGKYGLTAFIYICKPMLRLGASWLDRYVRTLLEESLAGGLEQGFVNGNGVNAPIGMIKNLAGPVDPGTGYPDKAATALADFSITNLGAVIETLKVDGAGNSRTVDSFFFAYNPLDEVKVLKARKVLSVNGYIDVVPYPIDFVQSSEVPQGKAVLGIKNGYMGILVGSKEGQIEFSDHYKFLEQDRTYIVTLLGNGLPKDNTSFAYLDIASLAPFLPQVETVAGT